MSKAHSVETVAFILAQRADYWHLRQHELTVEANHYTRQGDKLAASLCQRMSIMAQQVFEENYSLKLDLQ